MFNSIWWIYIEKLWNPKKKTPEVCKPCHEYNHYQKTKTMLLSSEIIFSCFWTVWKMTDRISPNPALSGSATLLKAYIFFVVRGYVRYHSTVVWLWNHLMPNILLNIVKFYIFLSTIKEYFSQQNLLTSRILWTILKY